MKEKILFLIQRPNQGGLKNLVDGWILALEKNNFKVDLKIVEDQNYNLNGYKLIHLFFSPFYSKGLLFDLFIKKIFSNKGNVIATYYNIKEEPKFKVFLRKILIKLTINKLALPSKRMVNYYKELGIKNSFLVMPISDRSKEKKVKKRYISYFGALREDKGIENLLYISNFVPENIHSAGFSTGTKKSEEYFKRVKSSGKFVIHKKNYLNLISKSKVVLFPYNDLSSTIDTPLAMLEAMERGSVVLTSNLAPLKDFLPEECLVDNWKNKKEVLDKIKYLEKNNKKLSKKMMKIVSKLETDEKSFIKNYKKLFS